MIGSPIYHKTSCGSTMDWGKEVARDASHGTLLLADNHITPRGRHGRQWFYQDGQLMLTYILKPTTADLRSAKNSYVPLSSLFMAISNSVLNVLRSLDKDCVLKWPNDVFLENKKLAGTIIEPVWEGKTMTAAIVGIAVNVNNTFAEDGPLNTIATSIAMHTSEQYDLQNLRQQVSMELANQYNRWQSGEYAAIYQQWRQAQGYMGNTVSVHTNTGEILTGLMHDVYPNGDLGLQLSDCSVRHLAFTQVAFWDVP